MAKVPGRSRARTNGILKVQTPYLRVPYRLLKSDDFLALSGNAVKVYCYMLTQWSTHDPDDSIEVSYDKLCKKLRKGKMQISKALKELMVSGYVHKVTRYRQCNRYYIEQKRFTGEY